MILEDKDLLEKAEAIAVESELAFERLEDLISHNLCMVSHFTGVTLT